MRGLRSVPETTASQPSKRVSSGSGGLTLTATFVPTSGKSSSSSFSCLVRIDDRGQRVVVDHHELGGVGARRAVVVTTTATISPTKRTASFATAGRIMRGSITGIGGGRKARRRRRRP